MVTPSRDNFAHQAVGAAAGLLAASCVLAASFIFHSRSVSDAFEAILPLLLGLVVSAGIFLHWRGFWYVGVAYVSIAAVFHVYAILPRTYPVNLFAVVGPRLVIDIAVLSLLLLPSVRKLLSTPTI